MVIKFGNTKINIEDIAILLMIVVTLAFHNYSLMLAIVQIICSSIVFLSELKNRKIKKSELLYFIWFFLFSFWGFLSIIWATQSSQNVLITVRSLIQEMIVGTSIVLYINFGQDNRDSKIIKYVFYASIILVLRMILNVPLNAWGTERVGIYVGYGGNGISQVLSYSTLLLFYEFQKKDFKNKKNVIFLIIFTIFSLLSGSKKGLLVLIIGIAIFMISKSKNIVQTMIRLIKVFIIILVSFYAIMNIKPLYNTVGIRFEKMINTLIGENGGDSSTSDRLLFKENAIKVFKKNPVIGVGLDNFRYYNINKYGIMYYAHDNYLEIVADLGIVGLLLYYILPILLLFNGLKQFKKTHSVLVPLFIIILLLMDIACISFSSDCIQLYLAIIYGYYIFTKNEKTNVNEV